MAIIDPTDKHRMFVTGDASLFTELNPYEKLMAAIIIRAYEDLDCDDEVYRNSAIRFFENPPPYVPDRVLVEIRKERERIGKPIPKKECFGNETSKKKTH